METVGIVEINKTLKIVRAGKVYEEIICETDETVEIVVSVEILESVETVKNVD